jgi:hypothetical protein
MDRNFNGQFCNCNMTPSISIDAQTATCGLNWNGYAAWSGPGPNEYHGTPHYLTAVVVYKGSTDAGGFADGTITYTVDPITGAVTPSNTIVDSNGNVVPFAYTNPLNNWPYDCAIPGHTEYCADGVTVSYTCASYRNATGWGETDTAYHSCPGQSGIVVTENFSTALSDAYPFSAVQGNARTKLATLPLEESSPIASTSIYDGSSVSLTGGQYRLGLSIGFVPRSDLNYTVSYRMANIYGGVTTYTNETVGITIPANTAASTTIYSDWIALPAPTTTATGTTTVGVTGPIHATLS